MSHMGNPTIQIILIAFIVRVIWVLIALIKAKRETARKEKAIANYKISRLKKNKVCQD